VEVVEEEIRQRDAHLRASPDQPPLG
jgi:hypothetical protein